MGEFSMKKSSAFFLQTATVLFGVAVLAFLLWEPHVEGRNAHATLFEIYFKDAFLACAYIASIPFFVALYQVFRLFGNAGRNEFFSRRSLSALRTIRTCAIMLLGSIAVAEVFLFVMVRGEDDIAGGVAMGILFALVFAAMATAAALFERTLRVRVLT
jgi:hypothetical protein